MLTGTIGKELLDGSTLSNEASGTSSSWISEVLVSSTVSSAFSTSSSCFSGASEDFSSVVDASSAAAASATGSSSIVV